MSLLKILKISESWEGVQEFDEETCALMDTEIKNCMQWLQEYFQTKNQSTVTRSEKQALLKIQSNYKKTIAILSQRQREFKENVETLRKGRKSERLYKDVAAF